MGIKKKVHGKEEHRQTGDRRIDKWALKISTRTGNVNNGKGEIGYNEMVMTLLLILGSNYCCDMN